MKISHITLNNFRQYYSTNSIDLTTSQDRNLVLIGGKNGYGKTNLLVGIVWCLYGEKIEKVDENFKKEIKKEGNYTKFLRHSLNKIAEERGITTFSVSLSFSEIEVPNTSFNEASDILTECKVTRVFDIQEMQDELLIDLPGGDSIFNDEEDKINFINDYLIPIEAAKFVFFDAEQISNMAALSTKEEGNIMNDALSKILGLDIYESLVSDLRVYSDNLKKESADFRILDLITNAENTININEAEIENNEKVIIDLEKEATETRNEIQEYVTFLANTSKSNSTNDNLEKLYSQKEKLSVDLVESLSKFNDLAELIPFSIAAGKIEEVLEHLGAQEEQTESDEINANLQKNILDLIEVLFNKPEFPSSGDISLSQKAFYLQKAEKVLSEMLIGDDTENEKIAFEHDITKADADFIKSAYDSVKNQSNDIFQQAILTHSITKNEIAEIDKSIKRVEVDLQDEKLIQYVNKKENLERKRDKLIEEIGSRRLIIRNLEKEILSFNKQKHDLIKKVQVTQQKKNKLDKAENLMEAIELFISSEKKSKCNRLENNIFKELQRLMHKLSEQNQHGIKSVKVDVLPGNDGLKVTLLNEKNEIIRKESLSQGEKQLYISSLIKAILLESVQEFPIFIDTPLGRLDDDHIRNTLLYYYPNLASQVVLMATNNEIPPSRHALIKDYLSKSYLLDHSSNGTSFKKGYFTV